jgi:hypothetical protein
MSAAIRLIIGLALAGVALLFYNQLPGSLAEYSRDRWVTGIAGVGAAVFILLGVLELSKKSRGATPARAESTADELRKLDELRKSGAITEHEFAAQKAKLL